MTNFLLLWSGLSVLFAGLYGIAAYYEKRRDRHKPQWNSDRYRK